MEAFSFSPTFAAAPIPPSLRPVLRVQPLVPTGYTQPVHFRLWAASFFATFILLFSSALTHPIPLHLTHPSPCTARDIKPASA